MRQSRSVFRVAEWRSSRHSIVLSRVGRNLSWLAGSTGFGAVASLLYVALTARTLGPRGFGSFALVMTYGELITGLAQFQSWKAVIGFGAAHHEAGEKARLSRLFGYAATLDWLSGVPRHSVDSRSAPHCGSRSSAASQETMVLQ
jgi:polysaccharide biosynthesis protein